MKINAYHEKEKSSQIKNLTLHFKELVPKVSKRKEITKIEAEINEIETKKTIKKSIMLTAGFVTMINKIDKPLARVTQEKTRGLK